MHPNDLIESHFRLNPLQRAGLARLRLETLQDLLLTFPSRYGEKIETRTIGTLTKGETASIIGRISGAKISKAFVKKIPLGELTITDQDASIKAVWYHQVFLAKKIPEGHLARISGPVQERKGVLYFANPEIEAVNEAEVASAGSLFGDGEEIVVPVYAESQGISSSWIHHAIGKLLKAHLHEALEDTVPAHILTKYNLPSLKTALVFIHSPKNQKDAEAARKRFAFEEVFRIQIARQRDRAMYDTHPFYAIRPDKKVLESFVRRFPFPLTKAQQNAFSHIIDDLAGGHPMSRLLEGDVGSGKTAVAALAAYAVVTSAKQGQPLQVAYMAPTEILATQQYLSFITHFEHLGLPIGLITGSGAVKFPSKIDPKKTTDVSRAQFLRWVASGEMPIIVGTHALIQKSVKFKNLALVVIDEQHRFGTMQRSSLVHNHARVPHLLSMTATPIPRTLALTLYGDLDLSVLDEMPAGRKPIETKIVPPTERAKTYEEIRAKLKEGRQLFVICPRIDEPDPTKEMALYTKSAKAEAARLSREVFPEFSIGVVHSKMKPDDKEGVMADFAAGKIRILVATSVVEVGVNVPNATMIIIEGAERFGLAQLHQLRGRVVRSSHQAYCYIFTETKSAKSMQRLKSLVNAKNGFELAEMDLALRGGGELTGKKQWGISDLGMEAIKNIKMVEAARIEAIALVAKDPDLSEYPLLRERIESETDGIHFE